MREAAALLGPLAGARRRSGADGSRRRSARLTGVAADPRGDRTVRHDEPAQARARLPRRNAGRVARRRSRPAPHAVYCGFTDETNARNFPGPEFLARGDGRGRSPSPTGAAPRCWSPSTPFRAPARSTSGARAVDDAQRFGADAVILADLGLLDYAAAALPGLRLHLSVQAAAANADAINFYAKAFGVKRVVLPRVLTVQEIAAINREIDVETEVFVFGGLCVMAEGRCSLSSYATGKSPNMNGACSPASHVEYRRRGRRARLAPRRLRHPQGRRRASRRPIRPCARARSGPATISGHVFEDPVSLDAAALIPQLAEAGVTALKIEGRQRSRAYIERGGQRVPRRASTPTPPAAPSPRARSRELTEGQKTTAGAYRKTWR